MAKHELTPEDGQKGGEKSKRGISIVRAIKEHFESGTVDLKQVSKLMCLMMGKNPAMARLIMEYIDGKVPEKIDANITGNVCHIDPKEYKKIRQEMLDNDDC